MAEINYRHLPKRNSILAQLIVAKLYLFTYVVQKVWTMVAVSFYSSNKFRKS